MKADTDLTKETFPFLLHLDNEDNSEGQVQGKEACAPLLKTNLKEDEHEPDNVKEMVAPSPKKMAKFGQASLQKKSNQQHYLKRYPSQQRHLMRTMNFRVQRVKRDNSQVNHNLN